MVLLAATLSGLGGSKKCCLTGRSLGVGVKRRGSIRFLFFIQASNSGPGSLGSNASREPVNPGAKEAEVWVHTFYQLPLPLVPVKT